MTLATSNQSRSMVAEGVCPVPPADAVLLARFVERRDEEAFTELVRRHGPMVWGVARRTLGDYGEAEDAFQAIFVVLARRAHEIQSPELLAGWLHGVAVRTSCKARSAMIRRHDHQRQIEDPETLADDHGSGVPDGRTWCQVMHEELSRLPDTYRAPLVLCYLEGVTHTEAAERLGWPSGSMSRRLARGRELLRQRMLRRGIALPAVALIGLLWQQAATAGLPAALVDQTVKNAMASAGPVAAAGGAAQAGSAAGGGQTIKLLAAVALVLAALLAVLIQTPLVAYVPWGDGGGHSSATAEDVDALGGAGAESEGLSPHGCCLDTPVPDDPSD